MLRFLLVVVAIATGLGAPARAQPASSEAESVLAAGQREYGAWVGRAMALYVPIYVELQTVQAAHAADAGLPVARRLALLRPRAEAFFASVARAEAEIARLDQPDFTHLGLAAALQPAAVKAELGGAMELLRAAVGGMIDMLDHAAAGRVEEVERSADRFSEAVRELNRAQVRFAEARMEATPPGSPTCYVIAIEVGSHRLTRLLLAANGEHTIGLGRDLTALADDIQQKMNAGLAVIEDLDREFTHQAASASTGSPLAAMLAKSRSILPLQRAQLEIGREFASLIRAIAADGGPDFRSRLSSNMIRARTGLAGIAEIDQRIAAALAAQP